LKFIASDKISNFEDCYSVLSRKNKRSATDFAEQHLKIVGNRFEKNAAQFETCRKLSRTARGFMKKEIWIL